MRDLIIAEFMMRYGVIQAPSGMDEEPDGGFVNLPKEHVFFKLFAVHDWLYHYEGIVLRQGREQVLARVQSRRAAEQAMLLMPARPELSRQSLRWRRSRGVHPDRAVQLCVLLVLVALALPGIWLPAVIQLLCLAVIGGLISSGREWRQDGQEDR